MQKLATTKRTSFNKNTVPMYFDKKIFTWVEKSFSIKKSFRALEQI